MIYYPFIVPCSLQQRTSGKRLMMYDMMYCVIMLTRAVITHIVLQPAALGQAKKQQSHTPLQCNIDIA